MNFRLLSFATLILAAVTAQAQFSQQTVSITGSVTDGNGKALEGARVSLMDSSTGATSASAYTNAQGTFIVDSVRPGMYEIVAQSGRQFDPEVVQAFVAVEDELRNVYEDLRLVA